MWLRTRWQHASTTEAAHGERQRSNPGHAHTVRHQRLDCLHCACPLMWARSGVDSCIVCSFCGMPALAPSRCGTALLVQGVAVEACVGLWLSFVWGLCVWALDNAALGWRLL